MQTNLCYPGLWFQTKYKERVPILRRPSDWNLIDKRFQYTSSSRDSLYKGRRSETSQKAIKIHWRVITKSCTDWKSVQQVLTFIPPFQSSRLFRHENCTISEVNRKKIELKCMYLVQAEAAIYCRGHLCTTQVTCCFHWNPVLMRAFFWKLSILKAHGLTRAESESLEEWGRFQLGSVNPKLLKTQALHAGYPGTAICLVEKVTKKGRLCFLKLQTFDKEKPLSTLCAHLTGKQLRSTASTHWSTSQSPPYLPGSIIRHGNFKCCYEINI